MKDFDDQDAVRFILQNIPAETATHYSDDAIQYFIDALFDFYDQSGMLDIDFADDDDQAEATERQAIIDGLTKSLAADRYFDFHKADIPLLVDAELAYEQSIL